MLSLSSRQSLNSGLKPTQTVSIPTFRSTKWMSESILDSKCCNLRGPMSWSTGAPWISGNFMCAVISMNVTSISWTNPVHFKLALLVTVIGILLDFALTTKGSGKELEITFRNTSVLSSAKIAVPNTKTRQRFNSQFWRSFRSFSPFTLRRDVVGTNSFRSSLSALRASSCHRSPFERPAELFDST